MNVQNKKRNSRRQLLFLGMGAAFIPVLRWLKPASRPKTVKMLTQEGKLVEVNTEHLSSDRKRITNDEIHSWVKTKTKK